MSNNKFWMYDVTQLFSSFDLLPNSEDSLAEKLNSIMRLTILLCAILSVYKPIIAISTLITVMAITTSVFSATSKQPINENFQEIPSWNDQMSGAAPRMGGSASPPLNAFQVMDCESTKTAELPNPIAQTISSTKDVSHQDGSMSLLEFMKEYRSVINQNPPLYKSGFPITQKRFCNDEVSLNYGPDYVSMNQSLVGRPSMKTTIPPLIAAPSHDSVWKENDFVIQSGINRETNFDYFRAGYNYGTLPTKCSCAVGVVGRERTCYCEAPNLQGKKISSVSCQLPAFKQIDVMDNNNSSKKKNKKEVKKIKLPELIREMRRNNISENEIQDMLDTKNAPTKGWQPAQPNVVEQFIPQFESPTLGSDGRSITSFQTSRKDNIITQTIQPGVYQKSHVGEPIQSNIGISYTQEFVPTEIDATSNQIKYTQQDPKNLIITPTLMRSAIEQSVENIYDPRFNGYGTSYRSYIDKLTGRPQFYYDDIDSITMPNYITRSNVDTFPWANTYGPDKIMDAETNDEYRQLANNAFHDSAIQFRTELQERLMRKRNAELWQRRVAPITTMKK